MENYKHRIDIEELIEKGESQNLEFKESLKLKEEIGETVSAFSNSDGGTVIIGVSYLYSNIKKPRDFTRLTQELGINIV